MLARPVDSAIVAERAPWSTKCSVVTNVTAAERTSGWSMLGGHCPSRLPLLMGAEVERIVATDDRLKEDARLGAWTTQHVAPDDRPQRASVARRRSRPAQSRGMSAKAHTRR
jgi:hypothetical protein